MNGKLSNLDDGRKVPRFSFKSAVRVRSTCRKPGYLQRGSVFFSQLEILKKFVTLNSKHVSELRGTRYLIFTSCWTALAVYGGHIILREAVKKKHFF